MKKILMFAVAMFGFVGGLCAQSDPAAKAVLDKSAEKFKEWITIPKVGECVAIVICVLLLFWIYTRLALKSGNLKENQRGDL